MMEKPKLLFINAWVPGPSNLGPKRKAEAQFTALCDLFDAEQICLRNGNQNRFRSALNFYLLYPVKVFLKIIKNKRCTIYYRYFPNCILLNYILILLSTKYYIYVEINTKHRDEFKYVYLKLYLLNLLSERLIYKSAMKVLVITPEVGDYVRKLEPQAVIMVMGNGYNPIEIELEGQETATCNLWEIENFITKAEGKRKFIWVGGVFFWDGLDRILALFSKLENACLFLVGDLDKIRDLGIDPETTFPDRVFFVGQRNLKELNMLYAHCDFGFGSFGQDRKKMRENPTLKVREYLYFGLPSIIGHSDPQLSGLGFVHRYQNMENLRKFLLKPFEREKIKQYARENLSWDTIMRNIFEKELNQQV